MLKKILLVAPEDPAASSEVRIALEIARLHDAAITGFITVDSEKLAQVGPAPAGAFSYRYALAKNKVERGFSTAKTAAQRLQIICEEAEIRFISGAQEGSQDKRLSDAWRFQDLAVLSTRIWSPGEREAGDAETLLHFVALGLRPLLAVPPGYEGTPRKAMVALSGSLESAKAFKHFIQMQPFGQIPVHLVTIGEPKSGDSADALLQDARDYAELHGFEASSSVLAKTPNRVQLMLDHARQEGADMFVIGSSYRHFLMFTRFGSHAQGLLNLAPCPVFVSH